VSAILVVSFAIKVISICQETKILGVQDPLFFFLSTRQVVAIAALVEAVGLALVVTARTAMQKALVLFWLVGIFACYRICLVVVGYHGTCPCFGSLAEWLGLSTSQSNAASIIVLAYLGSGASLILLRRAFLMPSIRNRVSANV
jgi:hypothetical protein